MTSRENIERWVAELDEDGMCNISDNQVAALIRGYNFMAVQLANAESKCRELAAENAGQKQSKPSLKAMMSALDSFYADEDVPETAMLIAFNILRGDIETPATDAFLAEVRAQGVEMAIGHIEQTICPNHETILNEFAAQLRKGAAL